MMTITHIIYHIPGIKVGCTANLKRRRTEYKSKLEVLEELHDKTDREAGDIEWDWAGKYGYPLGRHYADIASKEMRESARVGGIKGGRKSATSHGKNWYKEHGRKRGRVSGANYVNRTTPKQRFERASKAAIRAREIIPVEQQLKQARKGGRRSVQLKAGIHARTTEQISVDSSKGAARVLELRLSGMQRHAKCPHCGLVGNAAALGRWHFNNCKYRKMLPGEAAAPLPEEFK